LWLYYKIEKGKEKREKKRKNCSQAVVVVVGWVGGHCKTIWKV